MLCLRITQGVNRQAAQSRIFQSKETEIRNGETKTVFFDSYSPFQENPIKTISEYDSIPRFDEDRMARKAIQSSLELHRRRRRRRHRHRRHRHRHRRHRHRHRCRHRRRLCHCFGHSSK